MLAESSDTRLQLDAAGVLDYLRSHADDDGVCCDTQFVIGGTLGITRHRVMLAVEALRRSGAVTVVRQSTGRIAGSSNRYVVA